MTILKFQRGPWIVVVRLGLYSLAFGHRYWVGRPAEDWDLAAGILWFYVSRQR